MAPNVSIFSLPVYWLVVLGARMYTPLHLHLNAKSAPSASSAAAPSQALVSNSNPYSEQLHTSIQSSISPSAFARYERIQGAHRNGLENMALFFAAVILGNYAGLGAVELNVVSWLFVGVRILYSVLYIAVENERVSYLRSVTFAAGALLCLWLIVRAGVWVLYGWNELQRL